MARFTGVRRRLGLFSIALVMGVGGCSGGPEGLFGEQLFQNSCAACHGSGGEGSGNRPALDEGSNAARLTDGQIRGVLQVGPGAMPSFSRLTAEQIESLVDFLRSLQE